jgi:hypothetical protein
MPIADGAMRPPVTPGLILIPDGLIPDAHGNLTPHPALQFISSRLQRAARQWAESPVLAPIEWYAALLGVHQGASRLLAAALGDAVPDDGRQCWLFSPFAGRLGRDSVHIMPDELFAWDGTDAAWLTQCLQPLLSEDGFRILARDGCLLAVSDRVWDAQPMSFGQVSGHVLPDRHPPGADGGRMMRLCSEMQMLLASRPSERRRTAGLPDVMGVWFWAPSDLPAGPVARPRVISDDALIRACVDDVAKHLPVAVLRAMQVEAVLEHGRAPRHWLLAGNGHAVLLDTRSLPRLSRKPWRPQRPAAFAHLINRLQGLVGLDGGAA